jgi:hypothetical protein
MLIRYHARLASGGIPGGLLLQGVVMPVVVGVAWFVADSAAALAALAGCLAAGGAGVILAWREHVAAGHPEWDQRRLLGWFVRTAVERLGAVVLVSAIAFGLLALPALPFFLGFVAMQACWVMGGSLPGPRSRKNEVGV